MTLKTIQTDTQNDPDCAVIWLHGLGANGHDFQPIVPELHLPDSIRARFVFPHAPIRAVSLNDGAQMPAWYDIYSMEMNSREDEAGIRSITVEIHALIQQQIEAGIAANKVILAGFSQGGALALYAGMQSLLSLAGIVALSCYLPLRAQIKAHAENTSRELPILLAHGSFDDVLPIAYAQGAKQILNSHGFNVQWHEYPCAHSLCAEEIQEVRSFLLNCWA